VANKSAPHADTDQYLNVAHIITGLGQGGAEGVMVRLCLESQSTGWEHTVISLTDRGEFAETLEKAGVTVIALNMTSAVSVLPAIRKLRSTLRLLQPDVVQTWMYHSDFVGGIAARLAGLRSLVWGVRSTVPEVPVIKRSTRIVIRCCALTSRFVPAKIVVCAQNAVEAHARIGYRRDKMVVIQNGVDEKRFNQMDSIRAEWRESNGLNVGVPLLGLVARFTPQKDHLNLLKALEILVAKGQAFQCLLIGNGMDDSNVELKRWIDNLGLSKHVVLMGPRADLPDVMRALDLHVLSSQVEGFPNVLAEAMACGAPCVSTNVGDAEHIVADHGWVVPKKDAGALADALGKALAEYRDSPEYWQRRRTDCAKHIRENYGLPRMVDAYAEVWRAAARAG